MKSNEFLPNHLTTGYFESKLNDVLLKYCLDLDKGVHFNIANAYLLERNLTYGNRK